MAIYYNGIDIFNELGRRQYYFPADRCQMLCCCCWPPYHCALALSVIDATIVGIFAYRTADLLYTSGNNINWIDFGIFLILLGFFICELLSTITLAVSYRRNNSRYVLPRLILLTGQFAITTFISVILILYFMGFTEKLNDVVIASYEYWANDELNEDDRKRAVNELFIYAIGTFVVIFMYTVYELFELYITRKYQNTLDTPPEFIPVRSQEPPRLAGPKLSIDQQQCISAPPPPYNSQYR
ncbi:Uncharacterized protein BM_BM6132 [Brugia malayi]|uniref:Bm6132 n=2 Tax=Brugia malayi TaxID=6279 RepID=A0A4E9EX40_BRUMA|nr:Uncharacterized protein BM_BM6132 [Brugia malayi]VIO88475.1 Uncharacterized protein BM_BM6132 [Brugia malayi]